MSRTDELAPAPLLNQGNVSGLLGPASFRPMELQRQPDNRDMFSFFDGMGGIDGFISTMAKMQKVMGALQQIGPMLKTIHSLGSLFGGPVWTKSVSISTVRTAKGKRRTTEKHAYRSSKRAD